MVDGRRAASAIGGPGGPRPAPPRRARAAPLQVGRLRGRDRRRRRRRRRPGGRAHPRQRGAGSPGPRLAPVGPRPAACAREHVGARDPPRRVPGPHPAAPRRSGRRTGIGRRAPDQRALSAMFNRILVGVDGREGGRDALALAADLQRLGGGEIVAVHVYLYDRTVPFPEPEGAGVVLQEDLLTRLEAEIRAVGVAARPVIARDLAPARALHAAAEREDADLIVVGSCHLAGADRVLAGDDAANTL